MQYVGLVDSSKFFNSMGTCYERTLFGLQQALKK